MAMTSGIVAQGYLSGSYTIDTLYTAQAGSEAEHVVVALYNIITDDAIDIYFNGATSDYFFITDYDIKAEEMLVFSFDLLTGQDVRVACGFAGTLRYTVWSTIKS